MSLPCVDRGSHLSHLNPSDFEAWRCSHDAGRMLSHLPEFRTECPDACPYCGQLLGQDFEAQEVEAGFAYSCKACHNIVYFVPKDPSTVGGAR